MAKLRTVLFVLLTIAEVLGSKSPPANEVKDKEPRLAYFLSPRSTTRAPVRRSVDIQDNLTHQEDLVKENVVSKTVDSEYNKGTGLTKKNTTSRHCHRCKCAKSRRSQNSTARFAKRNRRDTSGEVFITSSTTDMILELKQHPLNQPHKTHQQQRQTKVKDPKCWTTINPSKDKPAASSFEVIPPASSSEFKVSDTSSEVIPPSSSSEVNPSDTSTVIKSSASPARVKTTEKSVAQTQLREEEDDEDANDYQDPVARLSHSALK